jgi:hypothetical protein
MPEKKNSSFSFRNLVVLLCGGSQSHSKEVSENSFFWHCCGCHEIIIFPWRESSKKKWKKHITRIQKLMVGNWNTHENVERETRTCVRVSCTRHMVHDSLFYVVWLRWVYWTKVMSLPFFQPQHQHTTIFFREKSFGDFILCFSFTNRIVNSLEHLKLNNIRTLQHCPKRKILLMLSHMVSEREQEEWEKREWKTFQLHFLIKSKNHFVVKKEVNKSERNKMFKSHEKNEFKNHFVDLKKTAHKIAFHHPLFPTHKSSFHFL